MNRSAVILFVYLPIGLMILVVAGLIFWISATGKRLPIKMGTTPPAATPEVIYERGRGRLVGKIILEDGSPNDQEIHLSTRSHRETKNSSSSYGGTCGPYTDTFDCQVESGDTYLLATREGYAPAGIGPFENHADGVIENLVIQFKKGIPLDIKIVDESGSPVVGAQVKTYAKWNKDNSSYLQLKETGPGEYQVEHASPEMDYQFYIEAVGFEYTSVEVDKSKVGASETIILSKAAPTTGTVIGHDGTPVEGAVFKLSLRTGGPGGSHSYGGSGKEMTKTDSEGKFSFTEIPSAEYQYGYIEAPDGRRMLYEDLQAGQIGLVYSFPKIRRIHGVITGSSEVLKTRYFPPKYKEGKKPYVRINHRCTFEGPNNSNHGELFYDFVELQEVEGHFEFTSKDLFTPRVQLEIGPYRVPIESKFLESDSDILVEFDLDTGKSNVSFATNTNLPPVSSSDTAAPAPSSSTSSE